MRMGFKRFVLPVFALVLSLPLAALAAPLQTVPGGRIGIHGMRVVQAGDVVLFAHIPMYQHQAHNVQLVFGGEFVRAPEGVDLSTGEYTLHPERMSLDDLIRSLGTDRPAAFRGVLYRGHFEQGGEPIAEVVVQPRTQIVAQQLAEPGQTLAPTPARFFVVARQGDILWLAHDITQSYPGFQQLLRAQASSAFGAPSVDLNVGDALTIVRATGHAAPIMDGDENSRLSGGFAYLMVREEAHGAWIHVHEEHGYAAGPWF